MTIIECPSCGCNDVVKDRIIMHWGKKCDQYICNECGHKFNRIIEEQKIDAIPYIVIRCPYCDSVETRVYSTQKPIRYHKCGQCERTFKSIES